MKPSNPSPSLTPSRTTLSILLGILLLGAVLRLAYLGEASRAPDFTRPHVDADLHNYWARGLAFGDWTPKDGNPDPEIRTTPYFRPPGYPYFLALLYKVGGGGYAWPKLAQMLLGLLSAVLAYRLARSRFGAAEALLWAGFMATNWVFIYFEAEFQEPALFIALLLATIWALLAWSERPSIARAALCGALLGVAGLVRPNALVLAVAALGWMLWVSRRHARSNGARDVAIAVVAVMLTIAPATLRNLAVAHELVPISTNGGINLFIGNNQNAEGLVVANTDLGTLDTCYDWPEIVKNLSRKLGHPVSHAAASRWFEDEARRYMAANPGRTIALLFRKALLFLGPLEPPDNKILQGERAAAAVLRWNPWSFALFWSLGLAGGALFVMRARRGEESRAAVELAVLLVLLALAWIASFLPFAVTARYRAPFVPLVLPFVAYLVIHVARRLRARELRPALLWIGVGAALFALANVNFAGYEPSLARWHYQRGIAEKNLGRIDAALPEYQAALALNPEYLGPLRDAGAALASLGRIAESIPYFERAAARDRGHAVTWMNLATAYEATGQLASAIEAYRRVLEIRSDAPRARQAVERLTARLAAPQDSSAPGSEVRP